MKNINLKLLAAIIMFLSGCESKQTPSSERIEIISISPAGKIKTLDEKSLRKHFDSVDNTEYEALDTIFTNNGRVSFYLQVETFDQLKQRIGFGSFDSWEQELKLKSHPGYTLIDNSELSKSLLTSGSKIIEIRSDQYNLLAFFAKGHFFGRIWDDLNLKTWAIQGEYDDLRSMANELSKLIP